MWQHTLPPELGMFVVAPPTPSFHPPPHPDPNNTLLSADSGHSVNVGVIPLLPSAVEDAADLAGNRFRSGAIHLWQGQHHPSSRTINFDHNVAGSGGAVATCQDCGNQAKKDCSHRRCRTCCRSRGLDCSTHVKSTWVSAARRRERQMTIAAGGGGGASSGSTSAGKKPRLTSEATTSHTSTSNTPRSYDTSSSQQDGSLKQSPLPGQVRAPAVFKCVRVSAVDDGDDEFVYQAVVKIGGHVFKGLLYDQGTQPRGDCITNLSDLHLGGGDGDSGGGGGGGGRNGESLSYSLVHPSEVYGGSGEGFIGGSNYGNTIN